jgi:hypothetical protein
MIVPGGGISLDGMRWIGCRPNYLLPVKMLSRLFRRLMLEMLLAAHDAGRLQFFGDYAHLAGKAAFKAYLAPLQRTKWFVYSKRPFAGPEQVLAYLSRYPDRAASGARCQDREKPDKARAHSKPGGFLRLADENDCDRWHHIGRARYVGR